MKIYVDAQDMAVNIHWAGAFAAERDVSRCKCDHCLGVPEDKYRDFRILRDVVIAACVLCRKRIRREISSAGYEDTVIGDDP